MENLCACEVIIEGKTKVVLVTVTMALLCPCKS